ncbi:hypothetical protein ORS3428_18295 [Mesorhizobium sp. ORS 3428]|nr:hypothetical protein ORS3428_18295 [Mesorhizobium sp. ORS 3428]
MNGYSSLLPAPSPQGAGLFVPPGLSVIKFHRLVAGFLVPDDLTKIRQLDDLIADRANIAVAALAKRRRTTSGRNGRRIVIHRDGLIEHRLPPWFFWFFCFLVLLDFFFGHCPAALRFAYGGFDRSGEPAAASEIRDGWAWMEPGFAATLSANITCQGLIGFSPSGRETGWTLNHRRASAKTANHRPDARAIALARQNRFRDSSGI